jgi:DNA primase
VDSHRSDNTYKSQVLAATNLVELVGRSVSLKHRGRNYVGLCPFHQEKSASFTVDPARQWFRCWGCGAKGNAIDFVMQRDRVEFIDALRQLGEAAGIEMPRYGQTKEKLSQRQALLDACSAAGAFFEKMLAHPAAGAAARAYLEERGFTTESVRQFQIGFAPDGWDNLLASGIARKHPAPLLATAGLVKPRERGDGFYDTFRNRLMFPIRDETGRVIAFGGRVMPGSQDPAHSAAPAAKYLNSPETPLFSKSRSIFGLDLAKQKIVESRTVAVVEGYTDVVMAHQFGATNVVSILGTAMTEQHVQILRRFADRIVLLFDADAAGDNAVNRAVELFLSQPIEIAIASLPDGLDPDEFLLQHGTEKFNEILAGAADALAYQWKRLVKQYNAGGSDMTAQQTAVREYLDLLARARGAGPVDSLRWGSALARVSRLTDIPVAELNRQFRQIKPKATPARAGIWNPASAADSEQTVPVIPAKPTGPLTARQRAERWILAALLAEPGRWHDVQTRVSVDDFTDPVPHRLAEVYWQYQQDEGEPAFNEFLGLLTETCEPAVSELAADLMEELDEQLSDERDPVGRLEEGLALLAEMQRRSEEQKHLADLRRMDQAGSEIESLRLLAEKRRQPDLRRF